MSTFSLGRKPENPEKTNDIRQSFEKIFPSVMRCSIPGFEPVTSIALTSKGSCSKHYDCIMLLKIMEVHFIFIGTIVSS